MLGILDWGIGGVSIYKLIKERIGDVPVVYFSDTGVTPYGRMSRAALVDRLNSVIGFLRFEGVTHLVIGCNAASTAIEFFDPQGLKIIGIIESGVAAAMKHKPSRLGLIGGRRTVLSGVYRNAFAEQGIKIEQRIAQPLSALIESGDVSSQKLKLECRRILAPMKNCSHILLACTHYPAIIPLMQEFVSAKTQFVDPADALLLLIKKWRVRGGGGDKIFTTGKCDLMKTAADLAWQVKLKAIANVRIV
ncbi:MAG: glutamate racemase [Pyrinomonadaceae bacterium]